MALICCCEYDDTCICPKVEACDGVHVFVPDCPQHILRNRDDQPASYKSIVHDINERRIDTIRTELA